MRLSFTNVLVLLLSTLFHTAVLAAPDKDPAVIALRQTSNLADPRCFDYSRTANLSTIGANSTYRSAFLQASRVGTHINGVMLNAAIQKLPSLTRDPALNRACGNLTTIAFNEAERNFTQGIVAQFSGLVGNPQELKAGVEVIAVVTVVVVIFVAGWGMMP
jgi:hypothetical protein